MKSKRVFVVGLALVLLAMVAGVTFAWGGQQQPENTGPGRRGARDGVMWFLIQDTASSVLQLHQRGDYHVQIINGNNFPVRIDVENVVGSSNRIAGRRLAAGEVIHVGVRRDQADRVVISRVTR